MTGDKLSNTSSPAAILTDNDMTSLVGGLLYLLLGKRLAGKKINRKAIQQ